MAGFPLLRNMGIRGRIAGGSLVIAILIAITAGMAINEQLERIVRDGTEAVLASDSSAYTVALTTEPKDALDPPGPSQHIAVVRPDGSVPVDTLPAGLLPLLPNPVADRESDEVSVGSSSYVVLITRVDVAGEPWTVIAARDAAEEKTILGQMRALLVVGLALIAGGAAAAAWVLASVSLGPVRRLRRSAEELSDSPSTELLEIGEANDEISQLARTLNDLIARLRDSALRERQLVSDASHELRTPIALLSAQLQVAVSEASSVEQMVDDVERARRQLDRLAALVNSLLDLSAIEAVDSEGRSSLAELERETIEAVDRARFRAEGRAVEIHYVAPDSADDDAATFAIEPQDFGRCIDNLVGNALRALGDSGRLVVSLVREEHSVILEVSDTGGGMDPEFESLALGRFTRERKGAADSGAGLGLAIVAAIVRKARGTIALLNELGAGLTVRCEFPDTRSRGEAAARGV
ncbi:Signal transduction histidine kinase [Paramicrobacterium humi]|uniref:histidine kinase n=1 Tax=Paramicrobacterium humi TaxID=640635 RepID=A0A1H4JPC9_9MICO|nr:HAMP domain-containing sensor histidine kinase [Microbacterium humi]SEB48113.1 Signal transduction histidine kinase [Microbacterium humi]